MTEKIDRFVLKTLEQRINDACEPAQGGGQGKIHNILLSGPWGSGKTTLLDRLVERIKAPHSVSPTVHVLRFSPWEQIVDEDPRLGFLRLLAVELKKHELNDCKVLDAIFSKKNFKRLFAWADQMVDFGAKSKALAAVDPITGLALKGGSAALRILFEALVEEDEDEKGQTIQGQRKLLHKLLQTIAELNKKERILLLVDDMDRARPEEAIAFLDNIYQLFMAQDAQELPAVISVWAVNTAVLEEFLYDTYRNLPAFDPNAYLEKIFGQRVSVPPLFHWTDEEPSQEESGYQNLRAENLWADSLDSQFINKISEKQLFKEYFGSCTTQEDKEGKKAELIKALSRGLNYAILGNLRLHARVRRDCIQYWMQENHPPLAGQPLDVLVRQARLFTLINAFRNFRDDIALYSGMWPHFINRLNHRWRDYPMERTGNPVFRQLDDPNLVTLLMDLGVIKYDDSACEYVFVLGGERRLQTDLQELFKKGY